MGFRRAGADLPVHQLCMDTVTVAVTVDFLSFPPPGSNFNDVVRSSWLSAVASPFPLGLLTVFIHLEVRADLRHLMKRPSRKKNTDAMLTTAWP